MRLVISGRNAHGGLSTLSLMATDALDAGQRKEIRAAMSKALAGCGTLSVAVAVQSVAEIDVVNDREHAVVTPPEPEPYETQHSGVGDPETFDNGPAFEAIDNTPPPGAPSALAIAAVAPPVRRAAPKQSKPKPAKKKATARKK